jgi:S1-C subfamily serine protease
MAGAGLFDLDGALVAVVLPCDGRYAALTPESVTLGLVQGRSFEGRLRALYGLRVLPLDETTQRHLGAQSGALVSEVWSGYAGERAGLRPGDVIASADLRPVVRPEDLQPLVVPSDRREVVLGVWRARRCRDVRLLARATEAAAAPPAGSPAEEAGIRPGDRLLGVDFVAPRTAEEARRALSGRGDRPVFVEVQSGEKRFGALLRSR